ncbi:DUF2218 domain-containing protein [Pseudodonghicola flavimaris]|uniref:DUF2218 domain-containing protein n=1 Tax=Pseudodonghicola flavimaris TaxID=3050036 RepID=A0ABT7F5C7_9RHOB|nr:DUF2218 domain-containing protein [Pseudodonghicola flavimaris]MDK3019816.1 DUF2218 domain-containing protein [Pseudodonghicola flavimaris]
MLSAQARLHTEHASKYLQQLCKHFGHKVEVSFTADAGHATLPTGPAQMTANDSELWVEVTARDPEGLVVAKGIIDSHLKRFAFREGFESMPWEA